MFELDSRLIFIYNGSTTTVRITVRPSNYSVDQETVIHAHVWILPEIVLEQDFRGSMLFSKNFRNFRKIRIFFL